MSGSSEGKGSAGRSANDDDRARGGAEPGSASQAPGRTSGDFTAFADLLGGRQVAGYAWCGIDSPARGRAGSTGQPSGGGPDMAAALSLAWPRAVGEEVACNSHPVRLHQGRLTVAVSSTVWAQSLQFMEAKIIAGLNDRLGSTVVDRIVFRHAGWQGSPARPSPQTAVATPPADDGGRAGEGRQAPFTAEQEAALASVERLELDPQLAARIVAAMKASFVREQQGSVR